MAAVETARAELVEKLAEVDDELGEMFIMEQVRHKAAYFSRLQAGLPPTIVIPL